MKYLLIIVFAIVLTSSCCDSANREAPKYELGDEVIYKLTGKSVLITYINGSGGYDIKYVDAVGNICKLEWVKEFELEPKTVLQEEEIKESEEEDTGYRTSYY